LQKKEGRECLYADASPLFAMRLANSALGASTVILAYLWAESMWYLCGIYSTEIWFL